MICDINLMSSATEEDSMGVRQGLILECFYMLSICNIFLVNFNELKPVHYIKPG